jgi:hypothetical protein
VDGRLTDARAECYRVELPSDLLVGTLDSLMVRAGYLERVGGDRGN